MSAHTLAHSPHSVIVQEPHDDDDNNNNNININKYIVMMCVNTESRCRVCRVKIASTARQWQPQQRRSSRHGTCQTTLSIAMRYEWSSYESENPKMKRLHYYFMARTALCSSYSISLIINKKFRGGAVSGQQILNVAHIAHGDTFNFIPLWHWESVVSFVCTLH